MTLTNLTKENDPNKHIPGKGCKCFAYGQHECGCDGVDWRSRREVQLEAENEELKKELAALRAELLRIQEIPEQEWLEVGTIVLGVLADAAKKGFSVKESDAVKALDRGQMYVARLKSDLSLLRRERDAYRGAVREARGSLGYGPLETMPSTIKVVRDILDNVIATYPKKETS